MPVVAINVYEFIKFTSVLHRKGSIVSEFNLYFTKNSSVDPDDLDDTLKSYLTDAGCKAVGPDCHVGDLVGVDITESNAGGKMQDFKTLIF